MPSSADKDSNGDSEDDTISKLLFDFGAGTTSHGIPRIFSSKSGLGRVVWLTLVTTSLVVVSYQATLLIRQYLQYGVVVTISVENVNGMAQDFPAVTICNSNRVKKSHVKSTNQFKLAEMDELNKLRYYAPCINGDIKCEGSEFCYKPYRRCNGVRDCDDGSDEAECHYAPCMPDEFTCWSGSRVGRCIPTFHECDRRVDCYNEEDEKDCQASQITCGNDQFKCEKGVLDYFKRIAVETTGSIFCIDNMHVCDGRDQCNNGTDEFCTCNEDEFACYDFNKQECIPQSFKCDGKNDCADGKDELVACMFDCADGTQTIHLPAKCNFRKDCFDGSDEVDCDWDTLDPCNTNERESLPLLQWRCFSGKCILNASRCDFRRDCEDGSDELECNCDSSEYFICNNGECVDRYARCNSINDCIDGEDETACKEWLHDDMTNETNTDSSWKDDRYQDLININQSLYKSFQDRVYKDRGFERVAGDSPPDWVRFMTFTRSVDFSDLEDVLKLNREQTATLGHDGKKFIQQCTFEGDECSAGDFYPFQHDKYGNCYTFNSGQTFRFDSSFLKTDNISTVFYEGNGEVLQSGRLGAQYGLKLTLFVEQTEYIGIFGQDAGVQVVVHPQDIAPFPEDTAIKASTGRLTAVAVRKSTAHRQPRPYGECREDQDRLTKTMFPDYQYSVQACLKSCLQQNMKTFCKCVDTLLIEDAPRCNILNVEQERCRQLILYFARESQLNCSCNPSCAMTKYDTIVSQSSWPSSSYLTRLLASIWDRQEENRQVLHDAKTVGDNLVRLEIFYEDLSIVHVAENRAYEIENLLGDIGGVLGLWIGLSVLTVCELLEFVFMACRLVFRRVTKKHKVQPITN